MMRRILIVSGKVYGVGAEGVPDEDLLRRFAAWGPKRLHVPVGETQAWPSALL